MAQALQTSPAFLLLILLPLNVAQLASYDELRQAYLRTPNPNRARQDRSLVNTFPFNQVNHDTSHSQSAHQALPRQQTISRRPVNQKEVRQQPIRKNTGSQEAIRQEALRRRKELFQKNSRQRVHYHGAPHEKTYSHREPIKRIRSRTKSLQTELQLSESLEDSHIPERDFDQIEFSEIVSHLEEPLERDSHRTAPYQTAPFPAPVPSLTPSDTSGYKSDSQSVIPAFISSKPLPSNPLPPSPPTLASLQFPVLSSDSSDLTPSLPDVPLTPLQTPIEVLTPNFISSPSPATITISAPVPVPAPISSSAPISIAAPIPSPAPIPVPAPIVKNAPKSRAKILVKALVPRNPFQARQRVRKTKFEDVAAAGKRCIDKIETVEEIEYDEVEKCDHSYDRQCHTTYVTEFESQQEEECDDNYKKSCEITYSPQAENTTVEICTRPLIKDCSLSGPEVCSVEYTSECWTRNDPHLVEDDVPACRTVHEEKCEDIQSGYTTEEKCTKWPKEVCTVQKERRQKYNPVTKCEKVPQEVCAPSGCGFVEGPEICHDEVKTVVTDTPAEVCDIQPQRTCEHVTKLVPKLTPVEECVDVPKEVCTKEKVNPRTIQKPVTKKWCYVPTQESGLA